MDTSIPKNRTYWKGIWKRMGAEKFRGTKNGSKPPCFEFNILSSVTKETIVDLNNLFEVLLNTQERVIILTFWFPEYPGSSTEGYIYQAIEYDKSGNIIYQTDCYFYDDKTADRKKIKNTDWAKDKALKMLNDLLLDKS